MRLLLDQDIYNVTANQLRDWGHDVVTVREIQMHRATDEDLLKKARESSRILITRDKDFAMLIFLKEELSTGVIFLRITPGSIESVHRELDRLLKEHTADELMHLFCVVEANRHRIRHLPG
jgi:predicted nuclease of predicted toxin-antitoxin system